MSIVARPFETIICAEPTLGHVFDGLIKAIHCA
jgi:hypothetical protein